MHCAHMPRVCFFVGFRIIEQPTAGQSHAVLCMRVLETTACSRVHLFRIACVNVNIGSIFPLFVVAHTRPPTQSRVGMRLLLVSRFRVGAAAAKEA